MSDVGAGTIMTLVIPLALLLVVLGWWALLARRTGTRRGPE